VPAFSELRFTVAVSSSIVAAVCSRLDAWFSVRADRSALPSATCAEAWWITALTDWISPIMSDSPDCIELKAVSRRAASAFLARLASISWTRLPEAMPSATFTAWPSGRVIERVVQIASQVAPASAARASSAAMPIWMRSEVARSSSNTRASAAAARDRRSSASMVCAWAAA
jgi:hypothetical protein